MIVILVMQTYHGLMGTCGNQVQGQHQHACNSGRSSAIPGSLTSGVGHTYKNEEGLGDDTGIAVLLLKKNGNVDDAFVCLSVCLCLRLLAYLLVETLDPKP